MENNKLSFLIVKLGEIPEGLSHAIFIREDRLRRRRGYILPAQRIARAGQLVSVMILKFYRIR